MKNFSLIAITIAGLLFCDFNDYRANAAEKKSRKKPCVELLASRSLKQQGKIAQANHELSEAEKIPASKILNTYTKIARITQRMPLFEELAEALDLSIEQLRTIFGPEKTFENFAQLKQQAVSKNPNTFQYVIDTDIFNAAYTSQTLNALKNAQRIIVTTAVAGSPVNMDFFKSLQNYAKRMNGTILIMPANMMTMNLDPVLLETPNVHIVTNQIELTPHLTINNIKITAKQIWPLSGLDRLGNRGTTQIIGSPKMHVRVVPTLDNSIHPHSLVTTGAITDPIYHGRLYIQRRTDAIAMEDHMLGALVLERNNGGPNTLGIEGITGSFHLRHIEYIHEKKGFIDLNQFYSANEITRARPKALVMGDVHVGETDQTVLTAIKEQILTMKPEYVVLHDLLNGHSISHHDRYKLITMAKKAKAGILDLRKEISDVVTFINALLQLDSNLKVVIVPSNHNFWLNRWLEDGEFMRDPRNSSIGLDLAKAYKDGKDPVEEALTNAGIETTKLKRILFLRTGGHFKLGPDNRKVELGQHGHAGANGSKGSLQTMLRGAGRLVYGHTHTDQRLNGTVNIGTSTSLILPYSKDGFSSWIQSLAIVGENGEIQVLRLNDGEWFTPKHQKMLTSDEFYMPEYPKLIPNG